MRYCIVSAHGSHLLIKFWNSCCLATRYWRAPSEGDLIYWVRSLYWLIQSGFVPNLSAMNWGRKLLGHKSRFFNTVIIKSCHLTRSWIRWMKLPQDRVQWRSLVSKMDLRKILHEDAWLRTMSTGAIWYCSVHMRCCVMIVRQASISEPFLGNGSINTFPFYGSIIFVM
jgi:hypothetical protein